MDNRKGENNYNNNYNNYSNVNNYNKNNNYNYHNTQNMQNNNNNINNYNQNNNFNNNNQNNYNKYNAYNNFNSYGNSNNNQSYSNNYNYQNKQNYNYNNNMHSNYNNQYSNNNYNGLNQNNINNNYNGQNQNNINNNYNGQNQNNINNNYNGQNQNNINNNYNNNYSNYNNQYPYNYNSNRNIYNNFNPNYNNYYGNMQNHNYSYNNYDSVLNNSNIKDTPKNSKLDHIKDLISKLKIKKILLIFFAVVIVFIIIKFASNLMKSYNVRFYINGASVLEEETAKCKSNFLGHCYLTLPVARRYDGEVLGYSKELNSKTAEYQIGQKIEIEEDLILYVISKKDKTLKIDTSNIDDLDASSEDLMCSTYNSENVCRITVPQFNKRGYENIGYSTSKGSKKITVIPGDVYDGSNTLYPVYKMLPVNKTYDVKDSFALSNAYVDVEKTCENNIASLLTEYIKTIDKYWPFFFHGQKIAFLGENTFNSYTGSGRGVGGVTYVETTYPDLAPLIVKCIMPSAETYDIYPVVVHELAHSFDMQYEYINKKRIAFEDDITALYEKYKGLKTNRPLSNYAFSGPGSYDPRIEFFAELMAFYYLNFVDTNYVVLQGRNFYRGNYPDDMKRVAEKYICIGKNNFDKTKCS